jgi:hypothetical protein
MGSCGAAQFGDSLTGVIYSNSLKLGDDEGWKESEAITHWLPRRRRLTASRYVRLIILKQNRKCHLDAGNISASEGLLSL